MNSIKHKFKILLFKFFSKNQFLSSAYYFITGEFKREQQAVLFGKYQYLVSEKNNYYMLRRNTHRLEKGLLMRPRKEIFATNYIFETVNAFYSIVSDHYHKDIEEIKWSKDVLEEYFSIIGENTEVKKARNLFNQAIKKIDGNNSHIDQKYIPYKRNRNQSNITYDELLKLSQFRRSVRWFDQISVPRELIDRAVILAEQSPTACNRQPYEFRIFDNPQLVSELSHIPGGTKGYADNIPTIIAVVGKMNAYVDERDRHLIYIDSSLAVMSLIYALETEQVSSCIINWPDVEHLDEKITKSLELAKDERVVMLLAVGYADKDGLVAYSSKKPIDKIRRYNFE
ncbi:nitroreductase family protein [Paraliobacillus ryukyuensis]|uniref:nitroreductase family protein n=1 Tax=Paraliobacillus ryukyuensis TaxID=200904 RepID=UPI0009A721EF|nr:nitroreductase family protein [Paraliobacillus ryukyuensis]